MKDFLLFVFAASTLWLSLQALVKGTVHQSDVDAALQSEPVRVRDSLDRVRSEVAEVAAPNAFLDVRAKDSLVLALQGEVRRLRRRLEKGGTAIAAEVGTKVDTALAAAPDSLGRATSEFNFGNWVSGKVSLAGDSLGLELDIRNSYLATVGMEKKGLFGRPRPVVEVVNKVLRLQRLVMLVSASSVRFSQLY